MCCAKGPADGMDSRTRSPGLLAAARRGPDRCGPSKCGTRLCPTPAVPAASRRLGGGRRVDGFASHNPPEDNGNKLFGSSAPKLSKWCSRAIEAGSAR